MPRTNPRSAVVGKFSALRQGGPINRLVVLRRWHVLTVTLLAGALSAQELIDHLQADGAGSFVQVRFRLYGISGSEHGN